MARRRRVLLLILVGAWTGMLLAYFEQKGRAKATAGGAAEAGEVGRADSTSGHKEVAPAATRPPERREQPHRDEFVSTKAPPRAEPPPDVPAAVRKAAYVRIVAALDEVEEAAVRKYGRKPQPGDKAEFTIPYRAFVDGQAQRARKQLADDLGLSVLAIHQIKEEGDQAGWPKR